MRFNAFDKTQIYIFKKPKHFIFAPMSNMRQNIPKIDNNIEKV